MLLATDILPEALGIEWGMSKEQCLVVLGTSPVREAASMFDINLTLQEASYQASLWFDE